jgi:hypothetical protein
MRELAEAIQHRLGQASSAAGISIEEAVRLTPVAAALRQNMALSGEMAKSELGWRPVCTSLLDEVKASKPTFSGPTRPPGPQDRASVRDQIREGKGNESRSR